MSDKITLRTINTSTYPWAHWPEINNKTKALRIRMDELDEATDEVIRENFAATPWLSFADALQDPRIAEDAQMVYGALRRISLVMIQDWVDAKHSATETTEESPNV